MRGADRKDAADRAAAVLARIEPPPEDAGRTEDEIMEDVLADIAAARKERRDREAVAIKDVSTEEIETDPPGRTARGDRAVQS